MTWLFRRALALLILWTLPACSSEPTAPSSSTYDLIFSGFIDDSEFPFLYRVALDGAAPQLVAGGIIGNQPSARPDGGAVVFSRFDVEGNSVLMLLRAGDSEPVAVVNTPGMLEREGVWSPNGMRLLFVSHRDDPFGDIFAAEISDNVLSNVANITPSFLADWDPAWSPDGSKVAFTSYRNTYPSIWVMDASGAAPQQITSGSTDYSDYFPSWSPDGSQLAFQRIGASASQIGVVSSSGGPPAFFDLPLRNYSPRWSPDGKYIAIASDDGDIRVLDVTGMLVRHIVRPGRDVSPAWIRSDSPVR